MGKGGAVGGSSTTEVKIPPYIEEAAKRNLAKAEGISQIGYVPYYGPDVAAFTPMQEASMQNVADVASAFGMAAPSAPVSGMPPAQDYGGVKAYSSAPLYEAALAKLQAERPGQYAAITDMFIDPQTGAAGSWGQLSGSGGAGGGLGGGGGGLLGAIPTAPARSGYNTATTTWDTPLSYLPGGVNTRDPSSHFNQAIARLTPNANLPAGSSPTTSVRPVSRGAATWAEPTTNAAGQTTAKQTTTTSGDAGCVVATHAVSSGAFTPHMKREAVVWCMNVLHGKWWGEAIRRGYRHLGRKKIEQGKAHEHYSEFRRYIAFANGSKRNLRGALTFTLRTAQFFVVGVFSKEV